MLIALAIIVALLVAYIEARRQTHYLKAPLTLHRDPFLTGKRTADGHVREYGTLYCGFGDCYLDWVDGDLKHTITQHHVPGCIVMKLEAITT